MGRSRRSCSILLSAFGGMTACRSKAVEERGHCCRVDCIGQLSTFQLFKVNRLFFMFHCIIINVSHTNISDYLNSISFLLRVFKKCSTPEHDIRRYLQITANLNNFRTCHKMHSDSKAFRQISIN